MKRLLIQGAVALGAVLSMSVAAAATVPLTLGIGAGVRAQLGAADFTFADRAEYAYGGPGSIGLGYTAVAGDDTTYVRADLLVEADWTSQDAGQIRLDWGWTWRAAGIDIGSASTNTNVAPLAAGFPLNWWYRFTATADGWFFGDYDVLGSGDTFGLQGLYLVSEGSSLFEVLGGDVIDPTGNGTFSVPLVAGQTYEFRLFNFGNLSYANVAGLDIDAAATATVNWGIRYESQVVPLPGTAALLALGLGVAGLSRRTRARR